MNIRRTTAAALAGLSLAAAGAFAVPSSAAVANSGTTVTFALAGSSLAITTPANPSTVNGSVAAGSQLTSNLGTTTVTDNTGSLLGWTVTATSTNLVKTGAPSTTISKSFLRFDTVTLAAGAGGALTSVLSADAKVLPGPGGPFIGADGVEAPVVVAVAAPLAGSGAYDVTGAVTLTVPPAASAGTYTAVVTQTVT